MYARTNEKLDNNNNEIKISSDETRLADHPVYILVVFAYIIYIYIYMLIIHPFRRTFGTYGGWGGTVVRTIIYIFKRACMIFAWDAGTCACSVR